LIQHASKFIFEVLAALINQLNY